MNKFSDHAWTLVVGGLVLAFMSVAAQANMQVAPISIQFEPGQATSQITLKNDSDEPLNIQATPRLWHQGVDGLDTYQDTEDLLIFPRLTTIKPRSEQVFRVGFMGLAQDEEGSFRLFIKELPSNTAGDTTLKFTVTMSIPVFVAPVTVNRELHIDSAQFFKGHLQVALKNSGNIHRQAKSIGVRILDAQGDLLHESAGKGWYVLAGVKKVFRIDVPEAACLSAASVEVSVELKDGSLTKADPFVITGQPDCLPLDSGE